MTQIAAADREAMNKLFNSAVTAGCKTAGIYDKNSPENTDQAFKDRETYINAVEEILADDKKEAFKPNDEILD